MEENCSYEANSGYSHNAQYFIAHDTLYHSQGTIHHLQYIIHNVLYTMAESIVMYDVMC